ncbi:MAG: glycosyltransferase family 61 protein [Cyanobacteriota bacterium]
MLNSRVRVLLFKVKLLSRQALHFLLGVWRQSLDRASSIQILEGSIVYKKQHQPLDGSPFESSVVPTTNLNLKALNNPENAEKNEIYFETDYVWKLDVNESIISLQLCSSGTALVNQKFLLDLDYGTSAALRDFPIKLQQVEYPLVVAPWSHFFGGYYSFVAWVLAKLCRIEEALGQDIWQEAKVCYPLFNSKYEWQYLSKLGLPKDSLIDTRNKDLRIRAKSLILANNQTQINRVSPYDIELLRNRFCQPINGLKKKRIFLPRRSRRVLTNEAEVRDLLKDFGFEVAEDVSRTVDEQISLFQEASVIVGVHGAGLTNLLWCDPGTKVIELFYSGYTKPGFYYFCKVLGLEYSCVFDEAIAEDHFANQFHDMTINVKTLKMELERILS